MGGCDDYGDFAIFSFFYFFLRQAMELELLMEQYKVSSDLHRAQDTQPNLV